LHFLYGGGLKTYDKKKEVAIKEGRIVSRHLWGRQVVKGGEPLTISAQGDGKRGFLLFTSTGDGESIEADDAFRRECSASALRVNDARSMKGTVLHIIRKESL